MSWTVTALDGLARVECTDAVTMNREAEYLLNSQGIGIFDSVSFPPLAQYQSEGRGDQTAAYLNAILYLPGAAVEGSPPFELIGEDSLSEEDSEEGESEEKVLPSSYRRSRKPGDDFHTGGMIALLPDAASAAKLHIPGGDPKDELHVTLYFMSDVIVRTEEQRDLLRALLNYTIANYGWHAPIEANISGVGVLGDQDAKVYLVGDSMEMKFFYEFVNRMMMEKPSDWFPVYNSQREPWIAHLTVGYGDKVDISKMTYRGPITFDRVRLSIGETITDYTITEGQRLPDDALEYLNSEQLGPDTTVAVDFPSPSLKQLAESDIPANIRMMLSTLTNKEIAEEFLDLKERGNARTLSRYWTRGEGAPKIVWGRPGDFKACVGKLRKYVRDPEGLCAVYHHRATGEWPGKNAHKGLNISVAPDSVMGEIKRLTFGDDASQDSLSETQETKESR